MDQERWRFLECLISGQVANDALAEAAGRAGFSREGSQIVPRSWTLALDGGEGERCVHQLGGGGEAVAE